MSLSKSLDPRPDTPKWVLLTNCEDPDEMQRMKCCISSGSALFAKTKSIFRERNIYWRKKPYNPSIYIMDLPDLTASNFMEDTIDLKRVKLVQLNKTS